MNGFYCREYKNDRPADSDYLYSLHEYVFISDEKMRKKNINVKLSDVGDKSIRTVDAYIFHSSLAVKERADRPVSHYPRCKENNALNEVGNDVEGFVVCHVELKAVEPSVGDCCEEEEDYNKKRDFQRSALFPSQILKALKGVHNRMLNPLSLC